jgi:hypothetical protein
VLELRAPNAAFEIRRIPADFVVAGSSYDFDLEVVATEAHSTAKLGAGVAGVLQANIGGGFAAVPADVQTGFDLGTFTAGEKKSITIRLTVPTVRNQAIELALGTGV